MKDLPNKIILLIGMKAQGRTRKINPWCILKACYTLKSKWDDSFKVIRIIKTNTYHLQDMEGKDLPCA